MLSTDIVSAALTVLAAAGIVTIASDGTVAAAGQTVDQLTDASSMTATQINGGVLPIRIAGVDDKISPAALVAAQTKKITDLPAASSPTTALLIAVCDPNTGITTGLSLSALQSLLGGSSGGTTPSPATTYTITTSSSGTAGTAQTVTVATTGSLSSAVVVTLSDGASGAFAGTVTLAAGTNSSGTTQYTPASAGTWTISGTNNGGLTNPTGPSVTVAAAGSGGSSNPSMAFTGTPTFATGKYGQALVAASGLTGSLPGLVIPQNGNGDNQADFTLDGYVYGTGSFVGDGTPFLGLVNNGNLFGPAFNASGQLFMQFGSQSSSAASVRDGQWHYWIMVLSGSTNNGDAVNCYFFLDGVQVGNPVSLASVFPAGTLTVNYNGNKMKAGDLLDEVEVLKTAIPTAAVPSAAPTRYARTAGLLHFDGNGTGS